VNNIKNSSENRHFVGTANMDAIKSIYNEAKRLTKETGIAHEVDHIHPLSKGGLHHQDNLRVITWIENRKKGDKIIGRS
jgi:5-methylcytosine-specific restriction endonuclease McrA